MAAGGYDAVADALFRRCPGFDRFLLEFDDEPSGSFAPLAATPAGKTVVLGLVSTETAEVEPMGEIVERIREAAAYIPLEQLALSTQCGFASVVEAQAELTEDVPSAKLELVVRAAEQVWKD
jgi:5-methyltetrahydropteroyltriglutamate--homocysteine methyltransferase